MFLSQILKNFPDSDRKMAKEIIYFRYRSVIYKGRYNFTQSDLNYLMNRISDFKRYGKLCIRRDYDNKMLTYYREVK